MKKTKIICTVGPSTDKPGIIEDMIKAGMDIARFNFSHGKHEEHLKRIEMVRQAAKKFNKNVALLADTKGPEMRLGLFKEKVELVKGSNFTLTTKEVEGNANIASISYAGLPKLLKKGDVLLLSDGLISLQVKSVEVDEIETIVLNGGEISSRKRIAAPGIALDLPFLSEQDVWDVLFAAKNDMDFIAASFVQRAADILAIRKVLEEAGYDLAIVAKIENAEGVSNIDEIIQVSDGIMVARGDLGVEIPAEHVPLVQKDIISICNSTGTPVITATQMLESMMNNPRPTRAEASDIANAILDGSDAIMLSGETASGAYPIESVQTMATVAKSTEQALNYEDLLWKKENYRSVGTTTDAISHATVQIAHELNVKAILAATETGHTARMIAKHRPKAKVIAVTPHVKSARRMQLYWGIEPFVGEDSQSTDDMVKATINTVCQQGMVKTGDLVVITAGFPVGVKGTTNMINVMVVDNVLLRGTGIGNKTIKGKACVIRTLEDAKALKHSDIAVVRGLNEEIIEYVLKALAIVAEEDGLTSNAAIVGVSYGIPTIVGVKNATNVLTSNIDIVVETSRGLIYYGK